MKIHPKTTSQVQVPQLIDFHCVEYTFAELTAILLEAVKRGQQLPFPAHELIPDQCRTTWTPSEDSDDGIISGVVLYIASEHKPPPEAG